MILSNIKCFSEEDKADHFGEWRMNTLKFETFLYDLIFDCFLTWLVPLSCKDVTNRIEIVV